MTLHNGSKARANPFSRAAAILLICGGAVGLASCPLLAFQPPPPPQDVPTPVPAKLDVPAQPKDEAPVAQTEPKADAQPEAKPKPPPIATDSTGRRIQPDKPTILAFKNVSVDQIVPFIAETTGKVIVPQPDVMARRVTILNDQEIPRAKALDFVVYALLQNAIAVVETEDRILLRDIAEIDRQDVPVIGPETTLVGRTDIGFVYTKVYGLQHATASNLETLLKASIPAFAKLSIDADSNQVVLMGNVGLLQRIELLLDALDRPGTTSLSTETYHLQNANADLIAQNIRDLFSATAAGNRPGGGGGNQGGQNRFNPGGGGGGGRFPGGGGGGGGGGGAARPGAPSAGGGAESLVSQNLRVTSNVRQQSVTVVAEKPILDQIHRLVTESWDVELPPSAAIPKAYELKNTDAISVRDTLNSLFGSSSAGAGGGGGGNVSSTAQQAAGRLAGQFTFQVIAESNKLLVMTTSKDNFKVIDQIIAEIDQPPTAGLPQIVELKHASSEELADQLNSLLSQDGTIAAIQRQETTLTTNSASASPFANTQTSNTSGTNANQQNQASPAGTITFWWQRSRPPTTNSGSSNLVSKIRIVPVWRQNALMILSPPEYQASLVNYIEILDQPGRQVMLSAIIAEISVDDETALGLRWSSSAITPANPENSIGINSGNAGPTITGQKNDLLPSLFDTSVLNIGVNINAVLQALAQKTGVNILSEPKIFTSDNQEAQFFSGQDIPFITDTQTSSSGNLVQSFDYRAVGISLNVRPRITPNRLVDLKINLELSSIEPNATLFGGFIVDRRQTTTHLILKDGQTVVVSGILRTEDTDIHRKVPGLGDIPLIGYLFQSVERTKIKTELVAFVTPYVVENDKDVENTNRFDRKRLKEIKKELAPDRPEPNEPLPDMPPPPDPTKSAEG